MQPASLVVVTYRSASLAIDAIRTARSATTGSLYVVVVDNSVDESEATALRPHADVLIVPEDNVGYAAAINRARRHCGSDAMIVCNADVRFSAGSIDRLLEVGAAVAGPALFWDDDHAWILPPSELQRAGEVLDRAIASRVASWARRRDRRRIRARLAFWS